MQSKNLIKIVDVLVTIVTAEITAIVLLNPYYIPDRAINVIWITIFNPTNISIRYILLLATANTEIKDLEKLLVNNFTKMK